MGFNFRVRHTWLISRQRARAFHPLQNPPILQNRPAGKAFYEIFKFGSTTTNLLTFSFGTLPLSSSSWVLCSKLLIISDETIIYFLFFLLGYRIYRVSNYDQMNFQVLLTISFLLFWCQAFSSPIISVLEKYVHYDVLDEHFKFKNCPYNLVNFSANF